MADVAPASLLLPSVLDGLAMPLPPPRGCTHFQLRQLSRRLGQLYDAELAAVGLKTTQFSLLSSLVALGPVRPADLARAMTLEPSTLTRNLQPLLAAGWAELGPGADGRSRTVRITPAGRALRDQARARWHAAQQRLNATLGDQRVAALHALIQESLKLLDGADAPAGEETPHG
jgi:DNA-binding MarR family transcriptional regulator